MVVVGAVVSSSVRMPPPPKQWLSISLLGPRPWFAAPDSVAVAVAVAVSVSVPVLYVSVLYVLFVVAAFAAVSGT